MPKPGYFPNPWTKQGRVRPVATARCVSCGYLSDTRRMIDDACETCRWAAEDVDPEPAPEKEDPQ